LPCWYGNKRHYLTIFDDLPDWLGVLARRLIVQPRQHANQRVGKGLIIRAHDTHRLRFWYACCVDNEGDDSTVALAAARAGIAGLKIRGHT
jgi:hypothetical protein